MYYTLDTLAASQNKVENRRVLTETQKLGKSELSISVKSSSKYILDPKLPKIFAKRSSSTFAEVFESLGSVPMGSFYSWKCYGK